MSKAVFAIDHDRAHLRGVKIPSWGYCRKMLIKRAAWLEGKISFELDGGKSAAALGYYIGELAAIDRILSSLLPE